MTTEGRAKKTELEAAIKSAMLANPVLAGQMSAWIRGELAEMAESYDHVPDFNETCRLQGKRLALKDVHRMVRVLP